MRRAKPNADTENFELALTEIKKAKKEITLAYEQIEDGKKHVRDEIDELLELIDQIQPS